MINKNINLIDLIESRNKTINNEAEGMDEAGVSELHFHKILFITFGQFAVKFDRELFDCKFQAWKYGPVEISFRNYRKTKKDEIKKIFDVNLNDKEFIYLQKIIDKFLKVSPWALVEFTHSMDAWMFHYNEEDKEHNQEIPKNEIITSIKEKNILIL